MTSKIETHQHSSSADQQRNIQTIDSLTTLKTITLDYFLQAKKVIQIYSHNLDPRKLNQREIERALLSLIRKSRYAKIQILISQEINYQSMEHNLVRLAQNYSSSVTIRIIPDDYIQSDEAFYLIDERRLLFRAFSESFKTEAIQSPSLKIQKQRKYFNHVWQQSEPASSLRSFVL